MVSKLSAASGLVWVVSLSTGQPVAGAQVVATTRFPKDAAQRYAAELDFDKWSDRLQIHGLDFRQTPSVDAFTRLMAKKLPRLDFILNNACQTVAWRTSSILFIAASLVRLWTWAHLILCWRAGQM